MRIFFGNSRTFWGISGLFAEFQEYFGILTAVAWAVLEVVQLGIWGNFGGRFLDFRAIVVLSWRFFLLLFQEIFLNFRIFVILTAQALYCSSAGGCAGAGGPSFGADFGVWGPVLGYFEEFLDFCGEFQEFRGLDSLL